MLPALALALATAWAAVDPALPVPITVSPTTLEIPPGRRSAVLEVWNGGDAPVDLQLRAYRWTEPDGRERLDPADEVVVSPAITTLAPHARQLFRVLRSGAGDPAHESAYRLRLNQLPNPAGRAVAISYEFLLPLFAGGEAAAPALSWSADGRNVRVANAGGRRVKLREMRMVLEDGREIPLEAARGRYVLAGEMERLALPDRLSAAPVRLVGVTEAGATDVPHTMSVASR